MRTAIGLMLFYLVAGLIIAWLLAGEWHPFMAALMGISWIIFVALSMRSVWLEHKADKEEKRVQAENDWIMQNIYGKGIISVVVLILMAGGAWAVEANAERDSPWTVVVATYDDCSWVCSEGFCLSMICEPGIITRRRQFTSKDEVNKFLAELPEKAGLTIVRNDTVVEAHWKEWTEQECREVKKGQWEVDLPDKD